LGGGITRKEGQTHEAEWRIGEVRRNWQTNCRPPPAGTKSGDQKKTDSSKRSTRSTRSTRSVSRLVESVADCSVNRISLRNSSHHVLLPVSGVHSSVNQPTLDLSRLYLSLHQYPLHINLISSSLRFSEYVFNYSCSRPPG